MFKSKLITERDMSKDFSWILHEPLIWEDEKYQIMVKEGFDFDYASIPTIITNILPKNGQEYDRAACLHDALYATQWLQKKECDKLFYDSMLADGVSKITAWSMYQAVRIFGYLAYMCDDKEELEKYRNLVIVGVK